MRFVTAAVSDRWLRVGHSLTTKIVVENEL
jgi:hypothetical protein